MIDDLIQATVEAVVETGVDEIGERSRKVRALRVAGWVLLVLFLALLAFITVKYS